MVFYPLAVDGLAALSVECALPLLFVSCCLFRTDGGDLVYVACVDCLAVVGVDLDPAAKGGNALQPTGKVDYFASLLQFGVLAGGEAQSVAELAGGDVILSSQADKCFANDTADAVFNIFVSCCVHVRVVLSFPRFF